MKNMKIIIGILLLAILLVGAYILYNKLAPMVGNSQLATDRAAPAQTNAAGDTEEPEKMPAFDFTVFDADGKEYKLSDFRGKPVVMNFWATWCGFCKVEMPDFQEKYDKYGEEVHFLMINMTDGVRETVNKASGYIEKEGFTFPVYYDVNMDVATAYQVNSLPITFFIDAEGNFVAHGQGALSAEVLQKGIDMLLTEE